LVSISIGGCDLLKNKSDGNGNLNATFRLSDTTGRTANTFHSGESFIMSFSLINTTTDTITYYDVVCIPRVNFAILRNDSLLVGSPAGCDNEIGFRYFKPRDTLQGQWQAPNNQWMGQVILTPGSYLAKVVFPDFSKMKGVNPVPTIAFSIIK